jgi:hypothetical protein
MLGDREVGSDEAENKTKSQQDHRNRNGGKQEVVQENLHFVHVMHHNGREAFKFYCRQAGAGCQGL